MFQEFFLQGKTNYPGITARVAATGNSEILSPNFCQAMRWLILGNHVGC